MRPVPPQDQQPRQGRCWAARREAWSPAMPAASAEGQPAALSLAEKAVCKVVYGAPRPHPLLLPVGLELWLYVQKMRDLQRKRCGGHPGSWGATGEGAGGQGAPGGSRAKERGGTPCCCLSGGLLTFLAPVSDPLSVTQDGCAGHPIRGPPASCSLGPQALPTRDPPSPRCLGRNAGLGAATPPSNLSEPTGRAGLRTRQHPSPQPPVPPSHLGGEVGPLRRTAWCPAGQGRAGLDKGVPCVAVATGVRGWGSPAVWCPDSPSQRVVGRRPKALAPGSRIGPPGSARIWSRQGGAGSQSPPLPGGVTPTLGSRGQVRGTVKVGCFPSGEL